MHTSKTAMEQSPIHTNAKESTLETSSALQTNEQWNNTPIYIRGGEKGFYATLGNYRITEVYEVIEHVEDDLNNPDAKIILNICSIMIDAGIDITVKSMMADPGK